MIRRTLGTAAVAAAVVFRVAPVHAHSGPPFPILQNRVVGPYSISIWSDPDTTDDGRAAGQFWVVLAPADGTRPIPAGTNVAVSIRPADRQGATRQGRAEPVDGLVTRQFVALVMDHEGPFGVHVAVDGPFGRATVEGQVDATYDLRPSPVLFVLYLVPFVAVGALWMKVLLRRRRARPGDRA